MYCIYIHKNKINGKMYVGQTKHSHNPDIRWKGGFGYRNNSAFYADIVKYGWDNFEHTIIAHAFDVNDANAKERFYIAELHTDNPDYGYNLTPGGGNSEKKKSAIDLSLKWYNTPDGRLKSRKDKDSLAAEIERYRQKHSHF